MPGATCGQAAPADKSVREVFHSLCGNGLAMLLHKVAGLGQHDGLGAALDALLQRPHGGQAQHRVLRAHHHQAAALPLVLPKIAGRARHGGARVTRSSGHAFWKGPQVLITTLGRYVFSSVANVVLTSKKAVWIDTLGCCACKSFASFNPLFLLRPAMMMGCLVLTSALAMRQPKLPAPPRMRIGLFVVVIKDARLRKHFA